jgi:hypothetical protein
VLKIRVVEAWGDDQASIDGRVKRLAQEKQASIIKKTVSLPQIIMKTTYIILRKV